MASADPPFVLGELIDIDELLAAYDFLLDAEPAPASRAEAKATGPVSRHQQVSCHQPAWLDSASLLPSKPTRKQANKTRKDEIKQLRQQVNELKMQLACTPNCGVIGPPSEGTASRLWMEVSQRQESERRRAEKENVWLREAVSMQSKLMQSLGCVLRSAEIWRQAVLSSMYGLLLNATSEDRDIVDMLVEQVDRHLSLRIATDDTHHHSKHDEKHISEILRDTNGGYLYEKARSRVLPFSAELVDRVTWQAICREGTLIGIQPTSLTADLIVSIGSLRIEGLDDSELPTNKTFFVVKRARQHGRVVTAWESISYTPESPTLGTPAMQWVQQSWGDTWRLQLPNGDHGSGTRASVRTSITAQGGAGIDIGERGLELVRVTTAAIEESGQRIEKVLDNMMSIEVARDVVS